MRAILCSSLVLLLATTASAQFSKTTPQPRTTTARTTDTTQRKTAEKARTDHATKAVDQAGSETDLANALLAVMDTDGDGVVTKVEYRKALAALAKVHKDNKGNMAAPDKAADPNAAADPAAQNNANAGAGAPVGGRGNEAMARFMELDRNHDGRLSADEVSPQDRIMLQGADLNGDGAVDARELQAFSRKLGDRMRAWAAGAGPNNGVGVPGDGGRKP